MKHLFPIYDNYNSSSNYSIENPEIQVYSEKWRKPLCVDLNIFTMPNYKNCCQSIDIL